MSVLLMSKLRLKEVKGPARDPCRALHCYAGLPENKGAGGPAFRFLRSHPERESRILKGLADSPQDSAGSPHLSSPASLDVSF